MTSLITELPTISEYVIDGRGRGLKHTEPEGSKVYEKDPRRTASYPLFVWGKETAATCNLKFTEGLWVLWESALTRVIKLFRARTLNCKVAALGKCLHLLTN